VPQTEDYRALAYPAPPAMANLRVILMEPLYPGNIGSVARALKTVAIGDLVLVRPTPFRDSNEARCFASGAGDLLDAAREVSSLEAATEGLHWLVGTSNRRRRGMLEAPLPVRQAAQRIATLAQTQRVGILFGREDFGLSSEDLARCNLSLAIPVAEGMPPLNLSHAVQVVVHEIFLASAEAPPTPPRPRATVAEVESLLRRFGDLFRLVPPDTLRHPPGQFIDSLRRIFSRAELEPRDVRTLHQIVRAVIRRLQPPNP
jgi:tRNA/rRNA methyltransferase